MADALALLTLAGLAFAGGALNSVAGGGTFLTFPALLVAGVGPIQANATSSVALWPASLAGAGGYREELRVRHRLLMPLAAASAVGGIAGAVLLLRTPPPTFAALVPWLLLAATLVFALGPRLTKRLRSTAPDRPTRERLAGIVLFQVVVAVYGGYFGGGMGILMLAALSVLGMEHIHAMNAVKMVLATVINAVAVAAFVAAGVVDWTFAVPMIVGATAGGYLAARYARTVDPAKVRLFVIAVGFALSAYFFLRQA